MAASNPLAHVALTCAYTLQAKAIRTKPILDAKYCMRLN
jgi:hypothetical protein